MQRSLSTLLPDRGRFASAARQEKLMLQAVRQLRQLPLRSAPFEHLQARLRASFPFRELTRNRQAVTDTLGWCGWMLAGGVVLFASWELGGFAVLLGQEPVEPSPAIHQPARLDPPGAAAGCTQASIDRTTGLTIPIDCPLSPLRVQQPG